MYVWGGVIFEFCPTRQKRIDRMSSNIVSFLSLLMVES